MGALKQHYFEQVSYPWDDADSPDEMYDNTYQSRDSASLIAFMPRVYEHDFDYIAAERTDVQKTWRKHGWQEPNKDIQAYTRLALNRITS